MGNGGGGERDTENSGGGERDTENSGGGERDKIVAGKTIEIAEGVQEITYE